MAEPVSKPGTRVIRNPKPGTKIGTWTVPPNCRWAVVDEYGRVINTYLVLPGVRRVAFR